MKTPGTRVVMHLAYPAHHLRTPQLFNQCLERRAIDAILVPAQVPPDRLTAVWEGLRGIENLAGVVVTIPHKKAVAGLCDILEGPALAMKVANVAKRMPNGRFIGQMFDGDGFVRGLRHQGHDPAGRRVLLLGAGGAAIGVAYALLGAGVSALVISNRTRYKAEQLVAALRGLYPDRSIAVGDRDGHGFDFVINGTSLGLHEDDALPIAPETLAPESVVADMVMNPDVTPLLHAAAARGCRIHKGVHMITGQIELLADFLFPSVEARSRTLSPRPQAC